VIYGSVCSGIEAASVAWGPLGWRCSFVSEIDDFPRAVLAHHYPETPLHGDFTTIDAGQYEAIDVLVGGTPCQSFSVAGLGAGLSDDRGKLALEFALLAYRLRPRWIVWENVPGVFSKDKGRAFGSILGALADCGYGLAWRVLDAQYFGLAQRRKRVFVVGYLGDWRRAAAVLFERQSLSGNPPPRREAGKAVAALTSIGAGTCGADDNQGQAGHLGEGFDASEDGTGRRTPLVQPVAFSLRGREGGAMPEVHDAVSALRAASGGSTRDYIATRFAVRRLTPTECERLQGFPDIENCAILRICKSEEERQGIANSAAWNLAAQSRDLSAPVAVDVQIDLERQLLQIRSLGKSRLSVSNAADASWSHLSMPQGDFVRLAALMTQTLARITRDGSAASLPNIKASSRLLNGSAHVLLCGQEIAALASDAERFTTALGDCTRSITSERGSISPSYGSTLETLACCVSAVISGFIPPAMKDACSFEIRLTTIQGYTAVPYRNKPAADGPRYKALGNSMAVPVMSWIGRRIAAVDAK